jgi:hypothetical protein
MPRGPKVKTVRNSHASRKGLIRRASEDPTSELSLEGQQEYRRLLEVLRGRGTLERVDLAIVTEAARIKVLIDRAYTALQTVFDSKAVSTLCQLMSQRRGLVRELGLTLHPSRSLVRAPAAVPDPADPIAARIKLSPDTTRKGG